MPIVIEPYRKEHEPAVEAFNRRMKAAGAETDQVFFRQAIPTYLPKDMEGRLYHEYFVALEDGIVRGGYGLKRQASLLLTHAIPAANGRSAHLSPAPAGNGCDCLHRCGWAGLNALHLAEQVRAPRVEPCLVGEFSEFGDWADRVQT